MKNRISNRIKGIFTDSMWSIAGLMLMNMVAQFVVYPAWGQKMGSEAYGNVLTLISYINILSVSVGSGCNYARMRNSKNAESKNGEYNLVLLIVSILTIPATFMAQVISGIQMSGSESVLYILLMCSMLWRYYADVDFRLSLDYRGFFWYYCVISIGYIVGISLYYWTGLWPLALLIGETSGLVYVALKGKVLRNKLFEFSANKKIAYSVIFTLVATNFLSNFIFNADRLLLSSLVGGTAVSLYYLASLLGKTVSLVTTPMNGVIIGYTARYKGDLTMRMLMIAVGIIAVAIVAGTCVCTVASNILIRILYADMFDMAKNYFALGNLSQIIYCTNNVLTTFLLCFMDSKYQLYINIVYAVAFVVICVPVTYLVGLQGFVIGLVAVNLIRFSVTFAMGLRQVWINQHIDKK